LNGWCVEVEPSGKINQRYDFLFYESETPNAYQYNSGWVVSRDTLSSFFSTNLLNTGFREREISDFTEYWIPRLTDHPFYIIYPQFADDIGKVIQLNISESPNNVQRLFYVIQGSENGGVKLIAPTIPKFVRSGFVVVEWGVVLK
jgi:internalin A